MGKHLMCMLAVLGLAFGLSSCEKAPELTLTGPTSFELSADGGSSTINFTANRDWRVNSSDNWITLSPSSGTASNGTIAVTVKCNANNTYDERIATVSISMEGLSQSVTVKQSANSGVLVPKTSYEVSSGAQTIEVEVQKNVNYTVEIEESCKSWIKKVGTKALTSEKIVFDISENTSYDARKGTITIIPFTGPEQTVVVSQAAKAGLTATKLRYPVGVEGGTTEIAIRTNIDFDIVPDVDWIHYLQTKALDIKTVVVSVDRNSTKNNRNGKVLIKQTGGSLSLSITISQTAEALEIIDLGLSVKWASLNIGAAKPEDVGEYFAWGETETKEDYSWSSYKWADGAGNKLIKYCSKYHPENWAGPGEPDGKGQLDAEDDVAYVRLGGNWRIPSANEYNELQTECVWEWVCLNGNSGYFITSNTTDGFIFLPAAGLMDGTSLTLNGTKGYYWANSGNSAYALHMTFYEGFKSCPGLARFCGASIRPVSE